jgi:MoaA/NifB/PqqE/SkfB family radical SAM enzyme
VSDRRGGVLPRLREIFLSFLHGRKRTAVFALTSRCNCKCIMCDMHRQPPKDIAFKDAKKVLETLARNGFLIVYFTGGEPTLHPNIVDIISYANRLGLVATMTTNGTPSKVLLSKLKDAGLYLLSVSLDHWDPAICERIRNHQKIFEKQVGTLTYLKEIGLKTYALAYLNPILLEDGVEKLAVFTNDKLGVPFAFCYPTNCDANSYFLGGELSKKPPSTRLEDQVQRILELKKEGKEIANLYCYVEDAVNFPNHHPNFYCRGGQDVIYVDWLGDVYPCFSKNEKLFNAINNDTPKFLKNIHCNDCLINCFREPSFLPQIFSPITLLIREVYRSYSTRRIYE